MALEWTMVLYFPRSGVQLDVHRRPLLGDAGDDSSAARAYPGKAPRAPGLEPGIMDQERREVIGG